MHRVLKWFLKASLPLALLGLSGTSLWLQLWGNYQVGKRLETIVLLFSIAALYVCWEEWICGSCWFPGCSNQPRRMRVFLQEGQFWTLVVFFAAFFATFLFQFLILGEQRTDFPEDGLPILAIRPLYRITVDGLLLKVPRSGFIFEGAFWLVILHLVPLAAALDAIHIFFLGQSGKWYLLSGRKKRRPTATFQRGKIRRPQKSV